MDANLELISRTSVCLCTQIGWIGIQPNTIVPRLAANCLQSIHGRKTRQCQILSRHYRIMTRMAIG